MSAIEITTDVAEREWDAFVGEHPDANLYHRWAWRRVFERALGRETCYLAARDAGAIVGVLPLVMFRSRLFGRCAVSLPYLADAAGVCASDSGVRAALVARSGQLAAAERLSHVEFRHVERRLPEVPAREHRVGMRLALGHHVDAVWNSIDRKVRNQIRKAEKSNLTVRSGGAELIDAFYDVFVRNMRDLGTPVFPKALFHEAVAQFADLARVIVIERGGVAVAGGIGFAYRQTFSVPWASSLREFRTECPNYLLYWHLIQHAVALRLSVFDFGRSMRDAGTYHFKTQWGAEPYPLYWECAGVGRTVSLGPTREDPKFDIAVAAWKRLPLPLTRWIGPRIVRSIP